MLLEILGLTVIGGIIAACSGDSTPPKPAPKKSKGGHSDGDADGPYYYEPPDDDRY